MKEKNSKFIKFFVVCLVCVFCFFGVNCVVNADSVNDTPDYQYMKTSYYNWDNITWYTEENTYVTGSNDTFSTETEFVDYYSINVNDSPSIPTDLSGYSITISNAFDISSVYGEIFEIFGYVNDTDVGFFDYVTFDYSYSPLGGINFLNDLEFHLYTIGAYASDLTYYTFTFVDGVDTTNQILIQWLVDNGATFEKPQNTREILSSDYTFLIERNNVYNDSLSDVDLFVYDSVFNTDLIFNSIVFEKNNFFMKVVDLNSLNVPMISASVLTGGYDITFEVNGFVRDVNGDVRDLSIVTDTRIDVLGYQTLYPTFQELFGNVSSINNDCMMYISNIRVLVEFPNNYVNNLSYRYSVSSIESNNIKYGGAFNSWVNSSINANLGSSLVDNINTFLQIEILPGLSFFGILLLAVAVPLLIWILKIFFGG